MYRPDTVKEILIKSEETYRYNCAFTFLGDDGKRVEITYKKLKEDVESIALSLIYDLKVKDGKAAIICCNCYEWCVIYLACLYSGVVAVPVDRELSGEDMDYILDFAEVQAVFCDKRSAQRLTKKSGCNYITVDGEGEGSFATLLVKGDKLRREGFTADMNIDADALAVIIFTSGTTGSPKGVMLSNRNLCSDLYLVKGNVKARDTDCTLSVLPLHHTYETIAFLMMLYCGGSIAFCGGIRYLARSFTVFKPTVFVTVPLILEKLHAKLMYEAEQSGMRRKIRLMSLVSQGISDEKKKKLFYKIHDFFGGKLQKIIVGAAALQSSVAEDFELFGFKVIIGYGLTECSPIVICNSVDDRSTDSIGRPLAETQVKIKAFNEKGTGELLIKGPMVMMGYYNNEKATAEVFSDGWFCTGDLGYCDKNGRYHLTGRSKNVIVTNNGKNVYPEELEFKLNKNPFIKDSLVYCEKGDIISCEILPDEDSVKVRLKKSSVSDEEIKSLINESVRSLNRLLPSYKRIKKVIVRKDDFSRTTTHKIKRKY